VRKTVKTKKAAICTALNGRTRQLSNGETDRGRRAAVLVLRRARLFKAHVHARDGHLQIVYNLANEARGESLLGSLGGSGRILRGGKHVLLVLFQRVEFRLQFALQHFRRLFGDLYHSTTDRE
jgi:hypothetical protein